MAVNGEFTHLGIGDDKQHRLLVVKLDEDYDANDETHDLVIEDAVPIARRHLRTLRVAERTEKALAGFSGLKSSYARLENGLDDMNVRLRPIEKLDLTTRLGTIETTLKRWGKLDLPTVRTNANRFAKTELITLGRVRELEATLPKLSKQLTQMAGVLTTLQTRIDTLETLVPAAKNDTPDV